MHFFLKSQIENSHIYVVPSSKAINEFKQIQDSELKNMQQLYFMKKLRELKLQFILIQLGIILLMVNGHQLY